MANEWTPADIHRVMRDEADTDGNVYLGEVAKHFILKSAVAHYQWKDYIGKLVARGLFVPRTPNGLFGKVITHDNR